MINSRGEEVTAEQYARELREMAITQLCLWGWEPGTRTYQSGTVEVRLVHVGDKRCFSKAITTGEWHIWPMTPEHYAREWHPCEWARFSTFALKRLIKLIGERDGVR